MSSGVPPRHAVPRDETWDLASIFKSDDAWEAEMLRVAEDLAQLDRFRGHLADSASLLADWFDVSTQFKHRLQKVFLYANLSHYADMTDQAAAARNNRAVALYARGEAALAFGEPEILAIGSEQLSEWCRAEPRLAVYQHYFDQLSHQQSHIRSAEVEELLNQVSDPFMSAVHTHELLADADLRFQPASASSGEPVEVAQSNISTLLTSTDRTIRRTAARSYGSAYLGVKSALANCLVTGVKQHVFRARARRYNSALEAALEPHQIPVEVFHNVLSVYRQHLPLWHRYWRVRRQALGYTTQYRYDEVAPLTQHHPVVSFEQACVWITEALQPLGEEYVTIMRRGLLEQRWVDRSRNLGKPSGAFSAGYQGTHPFIFMTYHDDLVSMSTLAHELGHSMHSYYTWETQPLVHADYSMFVAETASNFNQVLLRAHLLKSVPDREFQIAVIDETMAYFHRYLFLMPTLARFEHALYQRVEQGDGLTADTLSARMLELFREGYGDELHLDDDVDGMTWAQFPHLYANFYVFQYATGLAAAHVLAEGVMQGGPDAAERYVSFLKAGNALYPLEVLRQAGVDMTSAAPMEHVFDVLGGLIDRLEQLIKQR